MVLYYDRQSKRESVEWRKPSAKKGKDLFILQEDLDNLSGLRMYSHIWPYEMGYLCKCNILCFTSAP